MKTEILSAKPSRLAACLVLAGILASIPAPAQNTSPSPAQRSRQPPAEAAPKPKAEFGATGLFDIEIVDGSLPRKGKIVDATLENVVDVLRERHGGANIVLSPNLPRIRISNLKLRTTTLEQELEALRVASGNRFVWAGGNSPWVVDPATGLPVPSNLGAAANPGAANQPSVYILTESLNAAENRRRVEAFNLSDYFNSLGQEDDRRKQVNESLDSIKRMIVSTLDAVDPDHTAAVDFQFHGGANLLVVVGTPEALEVAKRVVSALQTPQGAATAGAWQNIPRYGGVGVAGGGFGSTPAPANPSSNKERRAIITKLESLRLEAVNYDGLPLSEVVRSLSDEIKKRDPEKRGINFVINPNQPDAIPGTSQAAAVPATIDPVTGLPVPPPPQEAVDIRSISIMLTPPLQNVRLVDVLDAIVRVADHPIKYTVTDYAVVFALRGPDVPMYDAPTPRF